MLLIDDDEAEPRHGRENRRAGAEHDARVAGVCLAPRCEPLPIAERRVQHGKRCIEARCKAPHELGRQSDLGHEQQGALVAFERALDQPKVHLGLAAPGHAVK